MSGHRDPLRVTRGRAPTLTSVDLRPFSTNPLSHDVARIPGDKLAFESALSSALRRCPPLRSTFPAVLNERRADAYYLLTKSERRRGPLMAAWSREADGWAPYVWNDGWDVTEAGEMLASWCDTEWSDWVSLGRELIAYYQNAAQRQAENEGTER